MKIAGNVLVVALGVAFLFAALIGSHQAALDILGIKIGLSIEHAGTPPRIVSGAIGILLLALWVASLLRFN